jgi:membrane-bound lytic murein transglycosylase F
MAGLLATSLLAYKGYALIFKPTALQKVMSSGELVIATRNNPTTYFQGPDGPAGFEYELAKLFADSLGVELKVVLPDNLDDIIDHVEDGDVDLAAAGLTVTDSRQQRVKFGPSYQEVTEQLVYNYQKPRPNTVDDLAQGTLEVMADSGHSETLLKLKQQNSFLNWVEHNNVDSEELLEDVNNSNLDYTVADSNEVALNRRYLLELRVAFDISEPKKLAWAFPDSDDTSLYDKAMSFFWRISNNGQLAHLIDRHFGRGANLDFVGNRLYLQHMNSRLTKYQDMFQQAADRFDHDWRLLAAVGYQESHWNPQAVSPTGVRGIMMLTQDTAKHLGVDDRLDPESSILGGARYLAQIRDRLPEEIEDNDRIWFALAAYNVGYYHLEDARKLAVELGKNPNSWKDMKTVLPLLAKHKWYSKTTYGYARGWEPVRYVENIQRYYMLLSYHLNRNNPRHERERPSFLSALL